jgi:hypothetical protein
VNDWAVQTRERLGQEPRHGGAEGDHEEAGGAVGEALLLGRPVPDADAAERDEVVALLDCYKTISLFKSLN